MEADAEAAPDVPDGEARTIGDGVQTDTIRRNAAFAFAAQIVGASFTAALTIFLAHSLHPRGFGVLSLALGISGLAIVIADFGSSSSIARFVAESRGDRARVAEVMADGLRLKFAVSAVVAASLFALAGPIAAAYSIHALLWPIRGVAVALFGQSVMNVGSVFAACGQVRLSVRTALLESASETLSTVALVVAGAGVTGAAFGRAIGYGVGAVATMFLLVRLLGREIVPSRIRPGRFARRIAGYAGVLVLIEGAYVAFTQLDLLVIGGYLSAASVGLFAAPLRLIALLSYPGGAIAAGVAPRLARGDDGEPNVSSFMRAIRLLLIVQAALTAFVIGWAPLATRVLGPGYGDSVAVLRGLAPYVFLSGFGPLVSLAANYLGEARRRLPVSVATVVVNLVLDLILVPRMGVTGACVGTDVAYALYAPAHLLICSRILRFDLRRSAQTLARSVVAAAAMTGLLLWIGAPVSRIWATPLIGGAAVVLYLLVLAVTGEVTIAEAKAALAGLTVRLRPPR